MTREIVKIKEEINAPLEEVFAWFFKSENFVASPIVFRSSWRKEKWTKGAKRDIIMIAGWYSEEITDVKKNKYIRYKVNKSIPGVIQDFTEIRFEEVEKDKIRITWTIELEVPTPFFKKTFNKLGAKMAGTLYKTILTAGKKKLEMK